MGCFWHTTSDKNSQNEKATAEYLYKGRKFATLTKSMISDGNMARAKKCFLVVEELFANGTTETKTVITNIYLYSVSQFMEFYGYSLKNLFPANLQKEYLKQVNALVYN